MKINAHDSKSFEDMEIIDCHWESKKETKNARKL